MSSPFGSDPDQGSPAAASYSAPDHSEVDYSHVQPDYGSPVGDEPVAYATWGQRVGALLIDSVFLFIVQIPLFALAGGLGTVNEALGSVVIVVGYLVTLVWFMLMEAGPYGQTPGKAAVGIQVRKPDGHMLSKGSAVGRYFSKFLSALPLYLGFLWPLWDAQKRTFHDMIVNSRVVRVRQSRRFREVIKGPVTRSSA